MFFKDVRNGLKGGQTLAPTLGFVDFSILYQNRLPKAAAKSVRQALAIVKELEPGGRSGRKQVAQIVNLVETIQESLLRDLKENTAISFLKAIHAAEQTGVSQTKHFLAKQYSEYAGALMSFGTQDSLQTAISCLEKSKDISLGDGDLLQAAATLIRKAWAYRKLSDPDKAYEACSEALSFIGYGSREYAELHGLAGSIENGRKNWKSAYEHFMKERRVLSPLARVEENRKTQLFLQKRICWSIMGAYEAAMKGHRHETLAIKSKKWKSRINVTWGILRTEIQRYREGGGSNQAISQLNGVAVNLHRDLDCKRQETPL